MPKPSDPFFASVLDLLLDAVCVVDAQGRFVFVSAACEAIFGYPPEEMVGQRMIDLVAPEDRERTLEAARRVMSGQAHLHFENRYVRKDGRPVDVMWSARWSESDQLRVAVARDITARKRAESMQAATYAISEAAHAAEDLMALFQQVHQIIGRILPRPHLAVALLHEVSGQLDVPYCVDPQQTATRLPSAALEAFCGEVIACGQTRVQPRVTPTEGPPVSWLGVPLSSQNGVIGALVLKNHLESGPCAEQDRELLQYVSTQVATAVERKRLHARLQHMAQYDALTGLPNRGLLQDRLRNAIARARREGRFLSLLYLDLDDFKQVNDTWGHAMGDHLLRAFAQRLKQCVRASDTVARLGGDEFVVLLESTQHREGNLVAAQKVHHAFFDPFELEGRTLHIQPSIGVAHHPEHGDDEHQLLRHADHAMYAMKRGRGQAGA
ncbi:MAG: diguanylate cyclase [Burkholderiales bacterium]|nr:diguanylate cyclase [Burkholderiales bacterium]MBH2016789.1 diguanylate cyclase [Burkholderiales bacterium]